MKLALILTHNKSNQENTNQINSVKSILKEVTDGPFFNEETGETWTTIHHEIIGLNIPHEVKVYQIVPFGVTPPENIYEINSGGIVYYLKGDEDKTGDHPRFFNWGLKRGTDYGAEIVIHLEDYKKLKVEDLPFYLNSLIDPNDTTEFAEDQSSKFSTLRLLKEIGLIDENKTKEDGIIELKQKVKDKGWKNG